MLIENNETTATLERPAHHENSLDTEEKITNDSVNSSIQQSKLERFLRIEWLGQTVASLCWIVSVFCYGISSTGDWLQLGAASAWFIANIAAVATTQAD